MKQKAKSLPRKPFCDDFQTRKKKLKTRKSKKKLLPRKLFLSLEKEFQKNFGKNFFLSRKPFELRFVPVCNDSVTLEGDSEASLTEG